MIRKMLSFLADALMSMRMYVYFIGISSIGLLTLFGDPAEYFIGTLGRDLTQWSFGIWYVVLGTAGVYTRAKRMRAAECMVINGLGVFTVLHGCILLSDHVASGLRLIIAVFMMSDWATMRAGFVIDRQNLKTTIRKTVEEHKNA